MDRQVALGSIHGRCQGGERVTIAKQIRVALVNRVFPTVLTDLKFVKKFTRPDFQAKIFIH